MTDAQQKTGGAMMFIAWIMLFGLVFGAFWQWDDKRSNPNQNVAYSSEAQSLQLIKNRYGHYTLSARVNGQVVPFLLDTGASSVVIPEALANELGLSRGQAYRVSTANGNIRVYDTVIDELKIGGIVLKQISAAINPYMSADEQALLGMSALKYLDFEQKGDLLTLSVK